MHPVGRNALCSLFSPVALAVLRIQARLQPEIRGGYRAQLLVILALLEMWKVFTRMVRIRLPLQESNLHFRKEN